tara:strand:+ start:3319 stop:3495 length:177 start_codon:yes stop_codon:yes gene_type:complete
MSKTGNWVFEMQEDAYDMTLAEFINKHGKSQAQVWHEVQEDSIDVNEYWGSFEMDDGA